MKFNKWTVGLAAVGVVSLASAARADEQMSQVQTALTQTTLSGYVDTAAEWNPGTDHNPAATHIPAYSFAKNDGFSLNAVDLALDKPEDSSQWAAGYHVELMVGPNAVGIGAVRQAYIRLHTPVGGNGIDWQVGVFDSVIGYESNSDPLNPNYTRSYGYTMEPTTLTGILGTYKVNDSVSVSAGVANSAYNNGFVSTTGFESQKAYFGTFALTAPDSMGFLKGATVNGGVIHAVNSKGAATFAGSTTSWYLGATVPTPMSQVKVGAAFDYEQEQDVTTGTTGDDLWSAGLYATIQPTGNLSFNARAEYFDDSTTAGDNVVLYPGNKGEEVTLTAQYALWANVLSRAEFRWDHVEHGKQFGAQGPAGLPDKNNDFLLALNLIYQF